MGKLKYYLVIFLLALVLRCPGVWDPPKIVFDEVAGMTYSLHMLYGRPYFDVHPPLVDLMYAGLIRPFHPGFVNKILDNDHQFGDYPYVLVRVVTAVAGSLIPVLGMLIGWELFGRKLAGLAVGLAMVLDNGLVVYSRLMLPDTWLLLFGLAAVAVVSWRRFFLGKYLVIGVLLAAAVAVKWTGLGFWAVVLGLLITDRRYKGLVISVLVAVLGYFLVWVMFFGSLQPGRAFTGIGPYSDKLSYPDRNNWLEIVKYVPRHHALMLSANNLLVKHEAASIPLVWIFGGKKIVFFTEPSRTMVMMGNLVGWWSVLAGVVCGLVVAVKNPRLQVLILGYVINTLPFLFIRRVFFVYHYLPALAIGYVILAGTLAKFEPKLVKLWLGIVVIGFAIIAPVTYGLSTLPGWLTWLAN